MKKTSFLLALTLLLVIFSNIFATSLEEVVRLSKNPSTLYEAREKVIGLVLANPSSSTILKVANEVYSKIKILESAHSTSQIKVARTIIEENKDAFYSSLASSKISVLPKDFSLVFNIFDIAQDYSNFFSHINEGDYVDALRYFKKMKYLYKIPSLSTFLPKEDTSSFWSFLAQAITLQPDVFDEDGAKFIATTLTPYDIRTLYMKTYVWLSGLSIEQAQQGLSVVEFENLISSFSNAKMDPNLLQWKYMTSKYLSLYTSISNASRQLSTAKKMKMYFEYVPTFFRAIRDFPLQYRKSLSQELSVYVDLLIQKLGTSKVNVSRSTVADIRKLATKYPNDPNSPKLMALTLNSNLIYNSGEKNKNDVFNVNKSQATSTAKDEKGREIEIERSYYYLLIGMGFLAFFFFIPRLRLSLYRILNLKGMEMNFYMRRLSKSPEDFRWHLKLANFYEKIGKFEEAQREYNLAMKLMSMGGNDYEDSK